MNRWALFMAVALTVIGCRKPELTGSAGSLRFEKVQLDFGSVFADGRPRTAKVAVLNTGRSTLQVTWSAVGDPFSIQGPVELPSGTSEVTVSYQPHVPGHFSRMSQVTADENNYAQLFIEGVAKPIPTCVPTSNCNDAHFDVDQQRCVQTVKADGVTCDLHSLCITDSTCHSGRCIGTEVTCDDRNACTVDVCNALTGCEFLPARPCPGDGRCLVGVCDSKTGCGTVTASDGTTCGEMQTCTAAQICIGGNCVIRDPPDGYVCAEASPCSGEGRCVNNVCVKSPGQPLVTSWAFDSSKTGDADAGILKTLQHDFVMEPTGEMSLTNFFQSPARIRANSATQSKDTPEGALRRCILWNGKLICADYPANPNGRVSAVDLSTGARVWTFDIRAARPDFLMLTTQIFLARIVEQGSDRIAALFEAYPVSIPAGGTASQCRLYFLVILDASGNLVTSQQLNDPLLGVCNHPHPYGVASDSVGNLFIAFSPTRSAQAPLKPDNPTMVMSFTHDGIFRWKLTNPTMVGGELAIARGILYPENSTVALTAATGASAFALPGPIGRVVISSARMIPSPAINASAMSGYEAGQSTLVWTHQLPLAQFFQSDQLRLANWDTSKGPRTVALTVSNDQSGAAPAFFLHAINVHDGSEAFSCPLPFNPSTAVQLMEVANGSLGVMTDALDNDGLPACGKCDPPFAGSGGTFYSVPLLGISVADEPWVGTFGGADHDHHEDLVLIRTAPN